MTHAAFLRVYEPLAAFPAERRERWQAYLAESAPPSRADGPRIERLASLTAAARTPPRAVPLVAEHAYVAEVDGVTLVCPWDTRLRALEALEELVAGTPQPVLGAYLPDEAVEQAAAELDTRRRRCPDERSHQLSATWHVPLRWFLLVEPEEREVRLGEPCGGSASAATARRVVGRSLVYRTAMSRARRRVARALALLRRTSEDGSVTAAIEDLGRWLEDFHPRSMVELDYGGLVHLLDDAELTQDESARDVAAALAALGEGAGDRASAAYERVLLRMKALQAIESAS
jgi:hypothetical protein